MKSYSIYFFLLMTSVLMACCRPGRASSGTDAVLERIAEDLRDEPPSTNFKIDDKELPGIKLVADKDHSSVSFRTKHWEIVDIIGWFADFEVVMYYDSADFSDAVIFASLDPTSLSMPNIKMAQSAQKEPYIDSGVYPSITFSSTSMTALGDDRFHLDGILQLNGISKDVQWDVVFNGYAYPDEQPICGFEARTTIDRNNYKVAGDARLHSGRKVHGDLIQLFVSVRME